MDQSQQIAYRQFENKEMGLAFERVQHTNCAVLLSNARPMQTDGSPLSACRTGTLQSTVLSSEPEGAWRRWSRGDLCTDTHTVLIPVT